MVDLEEVYVRDLFKKHNGKELYKGFYTVGKKIYQDDGEIINESIALDRETLEILKAKIMAILINELPAKNNSKIDKSTNKSKQTTLF